MLFKEKNPFFFEKDSFQFYYFLLTMKRYPTESASSVMETTMSFNVKDLVTGMFWYSSSESKFSTKAIPLSTPSSPDIPVEAAVHEEKESWR